jgi:hypothetical protein
MSEAPRIEVYFVPAEEARAGLDQPAIPPVAPAGDGTGFAATDERLRRMPLEPEGVRSQAPAPHTAIHSGADCTPRNVSRRRNRRGRVGGSTPLVSDAMSHISAPPVIANDYTSANPRASHGVAGLVAPRPHFAQRDQVKLSWPTRSVCRANREVSCRGQAAVKQAIAQYAPRRSSAHPTGPAAASGGADGMRTPGEVITEHVGGNQGLVIENNRRAAPVVVTNCSARRTIIRPAARRNVAFGGVAAREERAAIAESAKAPGESVLAAARLQRHGLHAAAEAASAPSISPRPRPPGSTPFSREGVQRDAQRRQDASLQLSRGMSNETRHRHATLSTEELISRSSANRERWHYERKLRSAQRNHYPFCDDHGELVCGFCRKSPVVARVPRLEIREYAPRGYVEVRVPYCGEC